MCIKPLKIYNNSHTINAFISQPLLFNVPCGKCYECQQIKSSEYYARSYYESLSTFKNGGYILYDTLTYSPRYVPRARRVLSDIIDTSYLSDFMVFDRSDFTNFMKRLRKRLFSDGYDYRNIKYLCCGEYGTSENGTHRPHLHLLFFVQNQSIPPEYLSRQINLSWQKGRTDGIDYRGSLYFHSNSLITSDNSNLLTTIYITKYVEKDCSYQRQLDKRLSYLKNVLLSQRSENYEHSYEYRLEFNKIRRAINQFQLNSQHFGEYIIDFHGKDYFFDKDYITFPSSKSIVRKVRVPRYILRKLFYTFDKISQSYILNDDGIRFRIKSNIENVKLLKSRYDVLLSNVPLLKSFLDFDVDSFLCSHPFDSEKLAIYSLFYRYRLKGVDLYDYHTVNSYQYKCDSSFLVALNTLRDSYDNCGKFILIDSEMIPSKVFLSKYCIHNPNFEAILNFFDKLTYAYKQYCQLAYERKQELKKRWNAVLCTSPTCTV